MKQKSKVRENSEYAKVPVFQRFFLLERLPLMDAQAAINGIQEVSGSIPLISTKNHRFHLESMVFLYFSACFVLGVFALDNKWTTDLLNFCFLTVGRKKLWHLSKKK